MSTTLLNSFPSNTDTGSRKRTLKEFQSFDLDSTLKEVESLFKRPKLKSSHCKKTIHYESLFKSCRATSYNEHINQLKNIKRHMLNYYVDDLINHQLMELEIQELIYNEDGLFLQNDLIANNLINIFISNKKP